MEDTADIPLWEQKQDASPKPRFQQSQKYPTNPCKVPVSETATGSGRSKGDIKGSREEAGNRKHSGDNKKNIR